PLFLEIQMDGTAPFAPRLAIESVPYAIRAGAADTANTANTAGAADTAGTADVAALATDVDCEGCVSSTELDFDAATQAELAAHAAGGDHDSRYVNTSGDEIAGALKVSGNLVVTGTLSTGCAMKQCSGNSSLF